MNTRIAIIGAGGHGKVIADLALKNGYKEVVFIDDNLIGKCMGFNIVGTCANIGQINDGKTDFIIAVGNNAIRKRIVERYKINCATLIHPSAQIGLNVKIGKGTVIMSGAVINPCATVGNHCIINTCAVIEHDCVIEDCVHISPSVAVGGTVHIGECTHVGIGAVVKNNVEICNNCIIGAGAVVVKDVVESATYVGIPAKKVGGGVRFNSFILANMTHTSRRCVA